MMHQVQFDQLPQPILPDHPHWRALYDMAWRLAAQHIREGRGRTYVDVAWDPSRNYQWVWDASFIALYCRYGNGQFPGMEGLDNFYELQRDDGYISMTYDMDSGAEPWPDRINPPLFAWAEWEYYRTTGDGSRLERVIGPIERLMDWIDANRRTRPHRQRGSRDGEKHGRGESQENYQLYWFEDGGSSGMDDAPRAPRLVEAGSHFDWVDLSSQMALSFACLARMHAALGHAQQAAQWTDRARGLAGDDQTTTLYRFDLASGRTQQTRTYRGALVGTLGALGVPVRANDFVLGPDGRIWTGMSHGGGTVLFRIDPATLAMQPLGQVEGSFIRLLFDGGQVYLSGAPHVRRLLAD